MNGTSRWIVFWILLFVSGCKVGPNYEATPPVSPPQWATATSTNTAVLNDRWWQGLHSPLLDQLVTEGLAMNCDRRAAVARIQQARAAAGIAKSEQLPNLDANANYSRSRTTESTPSPLRGLAYDNYALGFDASWEIDLFGRLARESEARNAEVQFAEADHQAITESLIAEVVASYADLLGATQRRNAAIQGIAAAEELRALTEARARSGLTSDLALASAELLLANARTLLPPIDRDWHRAANHIGVLVGRTPADAKDLLRAAPALADVPDLVALGLPAELVLRRPDLRAAESQLHAAIARLGAAMAERYPRLSISGFFGVEASQMSSLFAPGSHAVLAGPALHLPLFTGGRTTEMIAMREAQIDEARTALEQTARRAFEEVENAAHGLQQQRVYHATLITALDAATRTRDFAQQRFEAGLDNFLIVLEAEQSRLELSIQIAIAQTDLVRTYCALQKSLGGGVGEPLDNVTAKVVAVSHN
ncbi:MAG: efflux transporter outer membrane subunit [Planctomycetota bacterium]|nr:efflux transporter outer membrane subunit [Planctomycetota bacterium]